MELILYSFTWVHMTSHPTTLRVFNVVPHDKEGAHPQVWGYVVAQEHASQGEGAELWQWALGHMATQEPTMWWHESLPGGARLWAPGNTMAWEPTMRWLRSQSLRETDREGWPHAQSHTVLKPTSRGGRVLETVYRIFDLVFLVVFILVLSLMPRVPIVASKFYLLLKRGTYIASKYRWIVRLYPSVWDFFCATEIGAL
jgi:hypothetical protein